MPHFMQTVAAVPANYNASPDVVVPFQPDEMEIVNEGAADVLVSFDGSTNHDKLYNPAATKPTELRFVTNATKVWLKGAGGGAVTVMARTFR